MADITKIKRDLQAETDGVDTPYDPVPGITLKIARFNNPNYRKRLNALIEPFRAAWNAGDLPEGKADEIVDRASSEAILVGWDGVEEPDANGNLVAVPYSSEKAYAYFQDPAYGDFKAFVLKQSTMAERYLVSARKKALGN